MSAPTKHPVEDRCYYCASDAELVRALDASGPHPTIHMDLPETACPTWSPETGDPS